MPVNYDPQGDESSPSQSVSPGSSALPGLSALLRAHRYARDTGLDIWDFALEIDKLYDLGLTVSDLRWLVAKGLAEHGNEVSIYGDPHRSFDLSTGLNFKIRSCLILTADGVKTVAGLVVDSYQNPLNGEQPSAGIDGRDFSGDDAPRPSGETSLLPPAGKPRWSAALRELHFGDVLVKRFRVPARNQEFILDVFEEDDWPETIADPLPPSPDIDPKTRLHDAINRLNGKQVNSIMRFHGNGNGNGVCWKAQFLNPLLLGAPGWDEGRT